MIGRRHSVKMMYGERTDVREYGRYLVEREAQRNFLKWVGKWEKLEVKSKLFN